MKMSRAAYADMFGPTTGRQGAACRHRALHRGREGLHHLRRGGEVRRRQDHPRRHGPESGHARGRRGRYRHHQRGDPRSLGHRESRRRHQGRPHRRHRQGRQPGHPAQRRHHHRPRHRGDRGRGQNPHRRRLRQPHPFHLAAADRRRADVGRHHHARRRHRPRHRHQRHHLHARRVAFGPHDPGRRRVPGQSRLFRQGQRLAARRARGADPRRRLRAETARGLGHDPGGDRLLPFGRRQVRRAGDDPHRHAERIRLRRGSRSRRSRAAPFTPSIPKAPAAATRPTSSRSRACRTCCRRPPIRRGRSR